MTVAAVPAEGKKIWVNAEYCVEFHKHSKCDVTYFRTMLEVTTFIEANFRHYGEGFKVDGIAFRPARFVWDLFGELEEEGDQ